MALFSTSLSAAQWQERSSGIWEVRFSIPVQDSIFRSIRWTLHCFFHLAMELKLCYFICHQNEIEICTTKILKRNGNIKRYQNELVNHFDGVAKEWNLGLARTNPSRGSMHARFESEIDETSVLTTRSSLLLLLLEDFLQGSIPP